MPCIHRTYKYLWIEKTKKRIYKLALVYPLKASLEDDEPKGQFYLEFGIHRRKKWKTKRHGAFSLKVDGNAVLDHISFVPDTDHNDNIELKSGQNEKNNPSYL